MPLTPEQVKELKAQLISQVQHLPEDKKQQALTQIEQLTDEDLEVMLEEQKSGKSEGETKGLFRRIVDREIKAYQTAENKDSIAVLDINPISKGHTIIIPLKETKDPAQIKKTIISLANKVGKKIVTKLKAKSFQVSPEIKFGEAVINIIPIYDKPLTLSSPRSRPSNEDLEAVALQLHIKKAKPKTPVIKIKKESSNSLIKLERRIP